MNAPIRHLCIAALLGLAATASGQIVFTVTATANFSSEGYSSGSPYTFIFTTGSSFANNGSSQFETGINAWREELTTENQLWSSISGTGVSGTFVRPTSAVTDPYSIIETHTANRLYLIAGNDGGLSGNIGVTTPNGSSIHTINFDVSGITNFSFPGAYSSPNTYLSDYLGTYTPSGTNGAWISLSGSPLTYDFTVSSVSVSAVPEPSTYAALTGVAALVLAFWRRFKATMAAGG